MNINKILNFSNNFFSLDLGKDIQEVHHTKILDNKIL
jgi:hypothetical protein